MSIEKRFGEFATLMEKRFGEMNVQIERRFGEMHDQMVRYFSLATAFLGVMMTALTLGPRLIG